MDTQAIPLTPERLVELADYAKRHAQDEATALDTALAEFFAWEKQKQTNQPCKLSPEAFAAALDALTDGIDAPERPPIPDEALRRENLYPDRW